MKINELNLSALKYFLDAVELGSITLSAEKNHVSRPAVSQSIIRLGQWYGKPLLYHEKRSFELTKNGREFYHLAKVNYDNFIAGFSHRTEADDALRIGCSASLVELIFPRISGIIDKSQHPIVKVGTTQFLLSLLDQKQIHVAFLIENEKIHNYRTCVFHKGHFRLQSKTGRQTDLLITTEPRPETDSLLRYLTKKKLRPNNHIEVESWTLSHRLAEMMNAMCLVPDYLPKGNLKMINLPSWTFDYRALMVHQKESQLSLLESELVEKFQI